MVCCEAMFDGLEMHLKIPDQWQAEAVQDLRSGLDIVVDAPTGAGKTWIFEEFATSRLGRLRSQMVYTVPTRALANDKFSVWRARGWEVGLATGDAAVAVDAPLLVATLETQSERFLRGAGPALLVVDEYQMLADIQRGARYSQLLSLVPSDTQLLLLSGSVGNPEIVCDWLSGHGREVKLIRAGERPVPLDELPVAGLSAAPRTVTGWWSRLAAAALLSDLAPLLIFSPRRSAAEKLARRIAEALPNPDPLPLPAAAKRALGKELANLVERRVAYHHSGLEMLARSGVIEPLARHGQLRVIVATTGLAAGINFSVRSVLVSETSYQDGPFTRHLRPDELLQMFGRAGRRGLDDIGYVLALQEGARLTDAAPVKLARNERVEWSGLLRRMEIASEEGHQPLVAAREMAERMFAKVDLFAADSEQARNGQSNASEHLMSHGPMRLELMDSRGEWQLGSSYKENRVPFAECQVWYRKQLVPALSLAEVVRPLGNGSLCKLQRGRNGKRGRYGKQLAVGRRLAGGVELLPWLRKAAGLQRQQITSEEKFLLLLKQCLHKLHYGQLHDLQEHNNVLYARCDFAAEKTAAYRDSHGVNLLQPPRRQAILHSELAIESPATGEFEPARNSPLYYWRRLGLIDRHAVPTARGRIAGRFHGGEGLMIAAALEDKSYDISELVYDLANIRAGERFRDGAGAGERLAYAARHAYGTLDIEGVLDRGLCPSYGDGAATLIRAGVQQALREGISNGDYQRMKIEWQSLLRQLVCASDPGGERWRELVTAAAELIEDDLRKVSAAEPLIEQAVLNKNTNHTLRRSHFC